MQKGGIYEKWKAERKLLFHFPYLLCPHSLELENDKDDKRIANDSYDAHYHV